MANWKEAEEANILRQFEEFYSQKNIEEQCTEEDLMNLHEVFTATETEELSELQLQEAFRSILRIHISDEEFQTLFRKMNLKNDGYTTWNEFITYLLLEFQQTDTALQRQTLELPLTGEQDVQKTNHRSPVCKIVFCPDIRPDRTWDFLQGCYLTASRDGVINYWSLDFEYERSVQSTNPHLKVCPTTITDMVVLPDIQIVCTSSSERDLRFYDTVAKKFDLRVIISGLENAVVCMNYYFSPNIKENSYIVLGDMGGTVKVMSFNSLEKGPFKHVPRQDLIHLRYEAVTRVSTDQKLEHIRITIENR